MFFPPINWICAHFFWKLFCFFDFVLGKKEQSWEWLCQEQNNFSNHQQLSLFHSPITRVVFFATQMAKFCQLLGVAILAFFVKTIEGQNQTLRVATILVSFWNRYRAISKFADVLNTKKVIVYLCYARVWGSGLRGGITYIVGCQGVWQLGGLVPVVRLGVPLGCKAWKLCDPLSYPLDNERTLLWQ